MGSVCCCFHVPNDQNDVGSSDSNFDNCFCLKCLFKKFTNKRSNQLNRGETQEVSLPNSSNPEVVHHNSSNASGSSVANTASLGYLQQQSNEVMVRQENGTSRSSRIQPEPDRQTYIQENSKLILQGDKIVLASVKDSSSEVESEMANTFSDDEDVCPTCLEEYTEENPRITANCTHHYHLGCIYEWMERSERCPFCAELMEFDEV